MTSENSEALAEKEKVRVVSRHTNFPPPSGGLSTLSGDAKIGNIKLTRISGKTYDLKALSADGQTLFPKVKTNSQSTDDKKVIVFTVDRNNGSEACDRVDFGDSEKWNLDAGIAFFVDETSGDQIDSEAKEGVILIKQ